jgi:predicted ATPase with chaperone activity
VARTITDLEGCAVVDSQHVREALRLRGSHT